MQKRAPVTGNLQGQLGLAPSLNKTKGADPVAEPATVTEPPKLKVVARPRNKGADGRREAAIARHEAALKVRPQSHEPEKP